MKNIFKKVAITVIAVVAMSMAQAQTFSKGDNVVGASIGFGGYYTGSWYSGSGVSRIPYIGLYYENCVKDNLFDDRSSIGVGGMLGYTSIKWSDYWKFSTTVIGARGALHYEFVDKLDTYTGLMLGYNIVSAKYYGSISAGGAASDLAFSWFLGARYYFNEKIGILGEIGYGAANINLGLCMKF